VIDADDSNRILAAYLKRFTEFWTAESIASYERRLYCGGIRKLVDPKAEPWDDDRAMMGGGANAATSTPSPALIREQTAWFFCRSHAGEDGSGACSQPPLVPKGQLAVALDR